MRFRLAVFQFDAATGAEAATTLDGRINRKGFYDFLQYQELNEASSELTQGVMLVPKNHFEYIKWQTEEKGLAIVDAQKAWDEGVADARHPKDMKGQLQSEAESDREGIRKS